MKQLQTEIITLEKIVGGGQTLGTLADGRKAFVWGGLPGEKVEIQITKKKSKFVEGFVTAILAASPQRVTPEDLESYLSTSPWQIMDFDTEQHYKSALIEEAFELHDIVLPQTIEMYSDGKTYGYRNKVEFSWWWDNNTNQLDLAFFRRGTQGKIPVNGSSLARDEINELAIRIRDLLRGKPHEARSYKTLMIRSDLHGNCVWQLYIKDEIDDLITPEEAASLNDGSSNNVSGEVIYSDPKSPASRITKRLAEFGDVTLTDHILGVPFRYAAESFFQVNIPVYEQALHDMKEWVGVTPATGDTRRGRPKNLSRALSRKFLGADRVAGPGESDLRENPEGIFDDGSGHFKVIDLYSGVGSIGLTIGGDSPTLIEINENAVNEMKRNIVELKSHAHAVLAPSEKALDYLTHAATVIVDPPRAGLHADVITKLLETRPPRIIYLSCNPVTQARDVALLAETYGIAHHQGYNFFPRTPHIEHLVVLDLIAQ